MTSAGRSPGFWIVIVFLAVSIVLMLVGQTLSVFNYDLAVSMGLQEKPEEMTDFGVQVNRAFGATDTVIYVPLMLISLVGLILRKRWSLLITAAFFGAYECKISSSRTMPSVTIVTKQFSLYPSS